MTMVVAKRDGHWLIVAAQNGSPVDRSTLPGTTILVPSPLPTARDSDQTPSDVRKLLAEADNDWNQNDAKAVASLFADHADLVDTSARRFSGTDNIEKHIADVLAHQFHGTTSRTTILTSTTLGPDIAVLEVQWELLGEGRPGKTLTITRTSRVYPQQCALVGQRRSRHGHQVVACRNATMRKPTKWLFHRGFPRNDCRWSATAR